MFGLRPFVVSALGDAAAYQATSGRPGSTYDAIHARIRERVDELYTDHLGSSPVPLVVLAHSLGSHIISNYIWDTQHGSATGAGDATDDFRTMEWLAAMITFGSNIPLFTFAFSPVRPIRFPGKELPDPHASKTQWLNFYDRHDVLGYPLKPISEGYEDTVDEDIELNAGSWPASATPRSHTGYWKDRGFVNATAEVIAKFMSPEPETREEANITHNGE